MKLNKQKWFDKQMYSYEIKYQGVPVYNDNYELINYFENGHSALHRAVPEELLILGKYLMELDSCTRFFEARRIQFKHKKENRQCYLYVDYETKNSRQRRLKELIG